MPVLLFGIGVFAFIAGLVMIGFGIPINEFSFGNTLISAGTTASIGGLVIIAIGSAVRQLRRIAEMLADPMHSRLAMSVDDVEPVTRKGAGMGAGMGAGFGPAVAPALAPAPGRVAYPQRPKPDSFAVEPEPAATRMTGAPLDEGPDQFLAPSLRNPDEASVDDDISLSPRHPQAAPAPGTVPPGSLDKSSDSIDWRSPPPAPGAPPPRPQPQQANFDAMWPAEGKAAKSPSPGLSSGPAAGAPKEAPKDKDAPKEAPKDAPRAAPGAEPKADVIAREPFPANQSAKRVEPETPKPRTVAILKSGVVDGMGYTLYVDGSIEAELPQGTLRFASINELRSHLEKNS